MTKIRKLAGETVLYGLGNMVPRFLVFLLFPIYTNIFPPDDYGVFTYLMSIVAFLNVIYSFGMETAFFRFASKPGADTTRIFNVSLTVVIFIGFAFSFVFIVFSESIASLLLVPGKREYIIWLALIMFIDNISAIPFARLRLEKKAKLFALYRISAVVVQLGLNLVFLFVIYDPDFGIGYMFLAMLIGNSLYLIFFFRSFIRWRPVFDRVITPTMLNYSYPVMLTGLAAMTNEFFSRVSLERWLPENFYPGKSAAYAMGVFGASYRLAALMNLAVNAFRMAAEPFFFSNAAEKDSPRLFAEVNHFFVLVACFILLSVGINLDILKYLMDDAYWDGLSVVVPISLGYLLLGIYYNLTVWYKLTDRTLYGTLINVGGALLTILLNFLLIPVAGYMGSSWATVIVFGSMMTTCYFLGQKYYPIPYHVATDLFYIISTTLFIYAINMLTFDNLYVAFAVHSMILALWMLSVYFIERRKRKGLVD